jgi:hypothetical protein
MIPFPSSKSLKETYRQLATLYRAKSSIPAVQSSVFKCEPTDREKLKNEWAQSNYVPSAVAVPYLNSVSHIRRWKTAYFTLDIWIPETSPSSHFFVLKWLRRLETLRRLYQSTKSIHFICVPLPIPREFPKESDANQCLNQTNVNGGYTYIHQNTVYLFRAEELPKVLLHEYLHQIQGNKDSEWRQHPTALSYVRQLENIHPSVDIRPNEAVIEYWAWIYQQSFVALDYHLPPKRLWMAETQFIMLQAKRIYNHQRNCRPVHWYEETHVFSYYILKAFLVWVTGHRNREISLFYNIDSLIHTLETQWKPFKDALFQTRDPSKKQKEPHSARMTLLGDF